MKDDDLLIRFLQLKKVFLLLLISINELDLPGKEITKRRRILVYNLVIVEVSEVYQSFQFCSFLSLKGVGVSDKESKSGAIAAGAGVDSCMMKNLSQSGAGW